MCLFRPTEPYSVLWHLSWLLYPFVELKTGAAIASLVLLSVQVPLEAFAGAPWEVGYEPPAATAASPVIFRLVMTSSTTPYSTASSAVRM
jgi:hypothetical protein